MARIKIDIPEEFHFACSLELRLSQMNYGKHLSNEQILVMAHDTRERFFRSLGHSEMNLWGVGLIQADAAVVYKSEGMYLDEVEVLLAIEDVSRVGFDVVYLFRNVTQQCELARAKVGMVCFDYQIKKVQAVPAPFLEAINRLPKRSIF